METNRSNTGVLMASQYGRGIELTLTGRPNGTYVVAVLDDEGPLHITEFNRLVEALDWHDLCSDAIQEYIEDPTSQSITKLISTVH